MKELKIGGDEEVKIASTSHYEYITPIAKGAGILFIGNVFSLGLKYLFQIIVARNLDTELYGIFTIGIAVFMISELIASLGLERGIIRYVSLYKGRNDLSRVKGIIILAVALSLGGAAIVSSLLVILSKFLAVNVFKSNKLVNVLIFFAMAIPFSVFTKAFISFTQGLQIMKYKVYVKDLFELLSRIILVIVFFYLGWDLGGAVFAFLISTIGGVFLGYFYFRREFLLIMKGIIKPILEAKKLLSFCWPLLIANGFIIFENWMASLFLGYYANPVAVGIYGVAFRTSLLVQGFFLSFGTMFSPIIADLFSRKEHKNLERLFKIISRWVFSLSLPVAMLMIIFSREILSVFGSDFTAGIACLKILIIGQLLNSVTGPLGVMIAMSGRSKIILLNAVLHVAVEVVLCLWLIPDYNIFGAGLAKTFSLLFLRTSLLIQVLIFLKMHPFQIQFLKPLLAGSISWFSLFIVRFSLQPYVNPVVLVVLSIAVFLFIYGLMLFLLRFDEEDKIVFQNIKSKFGA